MATMTAEQIILLRFIVLNLVEPAQKQQQTVQVVLTILITIIR